MGAQRVYIGVKYRARFRQGFRETDAVTPAAAYTIFEQMALFDASVLQRVTLKVQYLPVTVAGDCM